VSKKSRTFQPPTSGGTAAETPAPATTEPVDGSTSVAAKPVTSAPSTSRAAARRSAAGGGRVSAPPNVFERYRTLIIGIIAVVLVGGAVGIVASQSPSTTASAYSCTTLLTPGPTDPIPTPRPATPVPSAAPGASPAATAAPEPQPTQKLGFPTEDMGRGHVDTTTKVDYDFCPPASGKHYNVGGQAPLARQFYPPTTSLVPGNWVHNLEHGYVVLLYRGVPTADVQQQLQDIMAQATPTTASATTCGYSKVIAVRFDDMDPDVNFAAVAWDRELLLKEFDKEALLTFANQWQDGPQTPESGLC